jgi:hypothetical protein
MTTTRTIDVTVSPFRAARADLATAIEAATGWTVHPSYTAAITTPCIILTGGGFTQVTADQYGYTVAVNCVLANQGGDLADEVEEVARLAVLACIDNQWAARDVPAPGLFQIGERAYVGVTFNAAASVTIREI